MKVTATRKPEHVSAHQFDGHNHLEIETALREHTGRIIKPVLGDGDVGAWIVLQPQNRWQTLPDKAFHRIYDVESSPKPRTCFECQNFVMVTGTGRCMIFDEPIDSEIVAARDCDGFTPEAP